MHKIKKAFLSKPTVTQYFQALEIFMKTVIFDMDGLLVDSEIRALAAWREVGEKYGIPDIDGLFPKILGTNTYTRGVIFDSVYGGKFNYSQCYEEVRLLAHYYEEKNPTPLKKGVKELLAYLKENGYRKAWSYKKKMAVLVRDEDRNS